MSVPGSEKNLCVLCCSVAFLCCVVLWTACAARIPPRPTGAGAPDPSAVQAFEAATRQCAGLTTLTAELRLSGRAAGERLRGTLHAGLAAPGALRFEAVAPFGPPQFILAGRQNRTTLLFPRDHRVLPDVPLADVLDRLTALALDADDVRLILSGCVGSRATATEGRSWSGGWRAVTLGSDITAYLRTRHGVALVAAADYGAWLVDYADHLTGWPRTVRIRSREPGRVDVTVRVDQLEINTEIDDRAFSVDVPPDAERITLNDLRAIAPLRSTP